MDESISSPTHETLDGSRSDAEVERSSGACDPPHALVRGSNIGCYVVLDRLGAGAMGLVWAAYDPELDRKVAIKLVLRVVDVGQVAPQTRRTGFAIARALWDSGHDRARALELARSAVLGFAAGGKASGDDREEATTWLAQRGDPG